MALVEDWKWLKNADWKETQQGVTEKQRNNTHQRGAYINTSSRAMVSQICQLSITPNLIKL